MSDEDTRPGHLDSRPKRVRLVNEISTGMLALIFTVASGFLGTYVTILKEQTRLSEQQAAEKQNTAAEVSRVKESIADLKGDVKELSGSMSNVKDSLAEIKAQLNAKGKP